MGIESEVDLSQRSCPELKSSPIKPHKNSTFSQYREHEVRYKKMYRGLIEGNAWLCFAFRDLGLIISRSHVRVLFHVFCSLKSIAFLGWKKNMVEPDKSKLRKQKQKKKTKIKTTDYGTFCNCLCFCPGNYWLKSTRDEMKRWNHGEPWNKMVT